MQAGKITLDELSSAIRSGEIDSVITAVPDMQGRLVGKRVTGTHFLDHCLEHGTHFCTYLLATDMEMETPPGFPDHDWDTGYGDYTARPDWATMRVIPWLERTALVLCDTLKGEPGEIVEIAPRTILQRQVERAAAMGFTPMMATELEFYLLKESFEEAQAKGYAGLSPFGWYNEDYHLSHSPTDLQGMIDVARTTGADLVLGSRYIPGGQTVGWPWPRKFISRLGGVYAGLILGVPIRDLTGGFKLWRRETLEAIDLDTVRSDGYGFQIETTYRALRLGKTWRQSPITFHDRVAGASKLSRSVVIEAIVMVWGMRFRQLTGKRW